VTAVSPPPSWYADPTGRHQSRFWDGFTWTAHVVDAGREGLDPLVQPAVPSSHSLPPLIGITGSGGHSSQLATSSRKPVADRGLVGHGTASLRLMAETGPGVDPVAPAAPEVADPRVDATAAARRRRRALLDGAALVAAVVLVGAIVALLSANGTFTRAAARHVEPADAVFAGDGYRASIPPSWIEGGPMPGARADMSYTLVATAPTLGLIGADTTTRAALTDPTQVAQVVSNDTQSSIAATGTTVRVVATDVVADGEQPIVGVTIDVDGADGTTRREIRYLVIGPEKSVAVSVTGDPSALDRAGRQARAVAESVRFSRSTPPTPGGGTGSTHSPT
jgi:hypothetical protein